MDYRFTDPKDVRVQLRKQDALSAEIQAFALECDLAMLVPETTDAERWEALAKMASTQREVAEERKGEEHVTEIEVIAARRQFLENWIKNVEQKHAEATASREMKAERKESTLEEDQALPQLEHNWAYATKALDELDAAQAVPSAPRAARRRAARQGAKPAVKKAVAKKVAPPSR